MSANPIKLTLTARDAAQAKAILDAVERIERGVEQPTTQDEVLVTKSGEPPLGHTYRELLRARRSGLLEAALTKRGLVLTRAALEAYRGRLSGRSRVSAPAPVANLTERRIRALENANVPVRRRQ